MKIIHYLKIFAFLVDVDNDEPTACPVVNEVPLNIPVFYFSKSFTSSKNDCTP